MGTGNLVPALTDGIVPTEKSLRPTERVSATLNKSHNHSSKMDLTHIQ